jgi:thiol-disulfide isomerase/thioredoxin
LLHGGRLRAAALLALLVFIACGPRPAGPADWSADFRTLDGLPVAPGVGEKPVVLVFWSSWAPPCTLLLRELEPVTARARVVTVLVDARDPGLEGRAAGAMTVSVPAADSVLDRYDLEVVPTTLVFDRQGRERARFEGYGPDIVAAIGSVLEEE